MNKKSIEVLQWGGVVVGIIIVLALVGLFQDRIKSTVFTGGQGSYPPSLTVPLGLGVDAYYPELPAPKELSMMHDAGFRWIRTFMKWKDVESTKGVYDFSYYDKLFNRMANNGIQPYIIISAKNDLYKGSPLSDKGQQGYAAFAAAIAKHYKGQHIVWEIMNEPNTGNFWSDDDPLDPVAYGKLAAAASKAMKQADANSIIVGPAVNGSEPGADYLDKVLQQGPAQYWNAISVHPYRNTPEEIVTGLPGNNSRSANTYDVYRAVVKKYAPNVPVMAGEVGWSTNKSAPRTPVNRYTSFDDEAKFVGREYLTNLMAGVSVMNWFNWKDNDQASTHAGQEWKLYHGIMKEDLSPKPAYTALKTLTEQLDGFTFSKRLPAQEQPLLPESLSASSPDYVLSFTKGSETRYAVWTSGTPHIITFAPQAGCYQTVNYLGVRPPARQQLQTDGQGNLTLVAADGIQYLANTPCFGTPTPSATPSPTFIVDPTPRPTLIPERNSRQ